MGTFLNKPWIKNLILSVMVIIIGGICSALGGWDFEHDKYIIYKIIVLVIVSIIYITALIYYSVQEVNLNKTNRIVKGQNEAFEAAMSGFISICTQSVTDINSIIHEIISDGVIDLKKWSLDKASLLVCDNIYNLLCRLNGESKEFEVVYVRLIEGEGQENIICMCGFSNRDKKKPSVFAKKRCFEDEHGYYDAMLFKENRDEIIIINGHEQINRKFTYSKRSRDESDLRKYNQYIAIPVFCNNEKMVGLLEIVCFHKTSLADTEDQLRDIASKYLVPYSYFILLLHKLEKGLLAVPKNLNQK